MTDIRCTLVLIAWAVPAITVAEPLELGASAGLTWSDNMRLASQQEESDLLETLDVTLAHRLAKSQVRWDTVLDLGFERYQQDSYDDKITGEGSISALWRPDPRFDLTLSDRLSQERINRSDALTPDNRTQQNVLSIEPGLNLYQNTPWPVRLSYAHVRTDYSKASQVDSVRNRVSARVSHALSPVVTAGLAASHEVTDFDDDSQNTRNEAVFTWSRILPSGMLDLQLGGVTLEAETGSLTRDDSGVSASLSWTHRLPGRARFNLFLEHTLDDSGSDRQAFAADGQLLNENDSQSSKLTRGIGTLTWQATGRDTTEVSAGYSRETELGQSQNSTQLTLDINQSHRINTLASAGIRAAWQRDASVTGFDTNLGTLAVWYQRTLSRQWSISSEIQHRKRTADLASAEWDENRIMLTLNWKGLSR